MAEIYTLSGSSFGAPPTETEIECAEKTRPLLVTGAVTGLSSVPVALFGTYKLLRGRSAAGIVGLLSAGALYFAGRQLMGAAARSFQACRTP
jgi:hypothetical protein